MSFSRAGLAPEHKHRLAAQRSNLVGSGMAVSQDAKTKFDNKHRTQRGHCLDSNSRSQHGLASGTSAIIPEQEQHVARSHKPIATKADAYKDHIALSDGGVCTRPSARLKRAPGAYKKRNPNIPSAFDETPYVPHQPRNRRPLTAAPFGHDLPSARNGGQTKVYPKIKQGSGIGSKKFVSAPPSSVKPEPVVKGKGRIKGKAVNLETEGSPAPPPRPKDQPVAPKYRSTPGLLKFSPRISSIATPRGARGATSGRVNKLKLRPANANNILAWNPGAGATDATTTSSATNGGSPGSITGNTKKIKSKYVEPNPITNSVPAAVASAASPTTKENLAPSSGEYLSKQDLNRTKVGGNVNPALDDKKPRTKKFVENSEFMSRSDAFSTTGNYGSSPPNKKTVEKQHHKRIVDHGSPLSRTQNGIAQTFASETESHRGKKRAAAAPVTAAAVTEKALDRSNSFKTGAAAGVSSVGATNTAKSFARQNTYSGAIWSHGYSRSPFDPGSARGVKPHAAASNLPPRRHVDPTGFK